MTSWKRRHVFGTRMPVILGMSKGHVDDRSSHYGCTAHGSQPTRMGHLQPPQEAPSKVPTHHKSVGMCMYGNIRRGSVRLSDRAARLCVCVGGGGGGAALARTSDCLYGCPCTAKTESPWKIEFHGWHSWSVYDIATKRNLRLGQDGALQLQHSSLTL